MARCPNGNGRSSREVPSSMPAPNTDPLRRRGCRLPPLAFVLVVILVNSPLPTTAQMAVIDAGNLIQTTISALKAIESVINEVEMIANQVKQIEDMVQNTRSFGRGVWDAEALPRLVQLGQIIEREQAIAYTMSNV